MNCWREIFGCQPWLVAAVLILSFDLPSALAQQKTAPPTPITNSEQSSVSSSTDISVSTLPDSPGTVLLAAAEAHQNAFPQQNRSQTSQSSSGQSQAPPAPEQNPPSTPPQKPVGTAAAETPNISGIAASQPAGIAIAPAKQRRARTLVLRYGAMAGAAVAIGTVVALTRATASKPPGAR